MAAPQIIDVIIHTAIYGTQQMFVIVDRPLKWIYAKDGNRLTAQDGPFFDFLGIEPGSSDAFAGRKFDVALTDGGTYACHGQVWSIGAPKGFEPLVQVGAATVEQLQKCYVFSGANVSAAALNDWLATNTPSNDYYKYDPRETPEWWDNLGRKYHKPISVQRARKLRRRGVPVWRNEDGQRVWSPMAERGKRALIARKEKLTQAARSQP